MRALARERALRPELHEVRPALREADEACRIRLLAGASAEKDAQSEGEAIPASLRNCCSIVCPTR